MGTAPTPVHEFAGAACSVMAPVDGSMAKSCGSVMAPVVEGHLPVWPQKVCAV